MGARHWFPHVPLAFMLAWGGYWLLQVELGQSWAWYVAQLAGGPLNLQPRLLPPVLISLGIFAFSLGLLLRSRVSWIMALVLTATAAASTVFEPGGGRALMLYFLVVLAGLLVSWRQFNRASVAASTLFALTAVAMLITYATFGSYYLGPQFRPPIADLATALYYAIVTMSTVGYGDILPQTPEARLFTISVIMLGVAVFATSLTAILAPLVANSLNRIVNRKDRTMNRRNHFIVIGNTSLAVNTWRELAKRGRSVTRILREAPEKGDLDDVDVVIGDPGSVEVLTRAGAQDATAVLAMMDDDFENAFVVLAVKELEGNARTVAAVNDAHHLRRIELVQPDVVIAPQVLGGELMAMMLSGEEVTSDFVMQRVFQQSASDRQAQEA